MERLQCGDNFILAMRTRMAWVYQQLRPAAPVTDLVGSSSGVSWVTRMHVSTAQPDYWVRLEAEERLPNRVYPKFVGQQVHRPLGPLVKVRPARPRAKRGREGWQRMVAAGAPSFLGFGCGDAQTRLTGECMFGARIQLPANVTLGEVVVELDSSGGIDRCCGRCGR